MFANQEIPTRASQPALFSNSGNFRGHYFQSFLKYKFNQHLNGHLWAEFILPGDFYTHGNLMTFLRAEIMMTY